MTSEGSAVNNENSQAKGSVDSFIEYFDQNQPQTDHRMTSQSHAIAASNAQEQLDSAIKLLCSKFTINTALVKKHWTKTS
eukprot:7670469-Ditylum_brightwellii.AAC.1